MPTRQIKDPFIHRHSRHQFTLNLMILGESGLGKRTFINTLFSAPLLNQHDQQNMIESLFELEEENVTLKLKIVQMPSFAECFDRRQSIQSVKNYLIEQYRHAFHKNEDPKIHLLLYFLSPSTTFHLKTLDGLALKELSQYCHVLPLIAKADTFTIQEMTRFKQNLLQDFDELGIFESPFPWTDAEKDLKYFPFSVMGSDDIVEVEGQWMRARQYPWGIAQVENHCDFVAFREIIIINHLHDFIESTCQYPLMFQQMFEKQVKHTFMIKIKQKELEFEQKEEALKLKRQVMIQELTELQKQVHELQKDCEFKIGQLSLTG